MADDAKNTNFAPPGWHTITTRIVANEAKGLVEFLKRVFYAEGEYYAERPAEIRIGDSVLMISEAGIRNLTPAFLYVFVEDCDATFRRAIDAGAISIEDPLDTHYGDRRCMVEDKWGNNWQIATRK